MKHKVNSELVILTLILIGSLKVIVWKSIDPSTFSKAQKEEIGLGNVHTVNTSSIQKKKTSVLNKKELLRIYLKNKQ